MINQYGIHNAIWQKLLSTCFHYPTVERVLLYGSRARGDYHQGSDIDIAIDAPKMSDSEFSKLWNALDDLPHIFSLDVVHLQTLQNERLLHAILKESVSITPDTN